MLNLENYWYKKNPLPKLLLPFSWLFCALVQLRRKAYASGLLKTHIVAVPVIIVGNITVGGNGKTPLVIWIVEYLKQAGYFPGIISRGYRGRAKHWPQQVRPDSDPEMVGDEAVLLAQRCDCPIAVGPDRVAAARALLQYSDCDVIISDDGLQHYALGRDIEIAVIDGIRRFGNQYCLPAGPLREPLCRLDEIDLRVCNGRGSRGEFSMGMSIENAVKLNNPQQIESLDSFRGTPVHAVAGIGNPKRFFGVLRQKGLNLIEHPFPDHHRFTESDITFDDTLDILMTEKDAVKCRRFANKHAWLVPADTKMDERFSLRLERELKKITGALSNPQ